MAISDKLRKIRARIKTLADDSQQILDEHMRLAQENHRLQTDFDALQEVAEKLRDTNHKMASDLTAMDRMKREIDELKVRLLPSQELFWKVGSILKRFWFRSDDSFHAACEVVASIVKVQTNEQHTGGVTEGHPGEGHRGHSGAH